MLLTVVTAGVALGAAGCGGTADGSASPATGNGSAATTTTSAAAPKFDPCAVLPADGLAKLGISGPATIDSNTGGCKWVGTDYAVSSTIYTYPLGQRPKNGDTPTITPLTVGSHKAELWRSDAQGFCSVDLALGANSLTVNVTASKPEVMDNACSGAKELATAAEPKLPTS